MRAYLKVSLIDDHNEKTPMADNLIGYIVSPGSVPQIIACFPEAPYRKRAGDWFCLNEVYRDADHRGHVSRTSVITISGEQLAELQETGRLLYGNATVLLFDAPLQRPLLR